MTEHGFLERAARRARSATSCAASTTATTSRRSSPSTHTRRSATPSRCCTSTASRSCPSSPRTTASRRRLGRRARPAAPRGPRPAAARRRGRRRHGAAVPRRRRRRPGREAVELLAGERQALLVTDDGRPAASSRAPTCSRPSRADGVRDARRPRRAWIPTRRYGSVIPAIHQTSTYVQPARRRVRRGLRLRALGQPDARRARGRARRARGRPRRSRSPAGWPRRTR